MSLCLMLFICLAGGSSGGCATGNTATVGALASLRAEIAAVKLAFSKIEAPTADSGPIEAGDDAMIFSPTIAASGSGWAVAVCGLCVLGWKYRLAYKGWKRTAEAVDLADAHEVAAHVKRMGKQNGKADAVEKWIRKRVERHGCKLKKPAA